MSKISSILPILAMWNNTDDIDKRHSKKECKDREHNPPLMRIFKDGEKYVCPSCGHVTIVNKPFIEW